MSKHTTDPIRHEPIDIEAEQAVLGAMLANNTWIDIVGGELEPRHFSDPLHQRMYQMILHLRTEGAVDALILKSVMKNDPGLVAISEAMKDPKMLMYFSVLTDSAPAITSIKALAKVLIDLEQRRALVRIGEDMIEAVYEGPFDRPARALAYEATDALLRVGEGARRSVARIGAASQASLTRLEERLERQRTGEKPASITTGLRKLDKVLGGLLPGDRIGIAARTGGGKSLFASSLSLSAARAGHPSLIISADMREQQWADRVMCDMDRYRCPLEKPIHYQRFRTGQFDEDEWARIVLAQQELNALPIHIDDNPVASVASIRGRARALAQAYPGQQGLLVVDFLQKIEPDKSGARDRRRDEDITAITYALGDIARDIGWTLIVLIQITNKDTDVKGQLREDPPNVTSIRESGGVEMALDIIVSPFRKAFFIERRNDDAVLKAIALNEPYCEKGWPVRNHLRLLGWKNRDGRVSDLNLDLWCDAGSAAVRDEEPTQRDAADDAADQLTMTV